MGQCFPEHVQEEYTVYCIQCRIVLDSSEYAGQCKTVRRSSTGYAGQCRTVRSDRQCIPKFNAVADMRYYGLLTVI